MAAADYKAYFSTGTTPQTAAQNWFDYGEQTIFNKQELLEAFNTIATFPGGSAVAAANLIFGEDVPPASTRYHDPIEIANAIKSNPKQFTVDNASDIGRQLYALNSEEIQNYAKGISALNFNTDEVKQINSGITQGIQQAAVGQQKIKEIEANWGKSPLPALVGGVFLSILLPGVGAAIGSQLTGAGVLTSAASASAAATAAGATAAGAAAAGAAATATATVIGTAIASTAVQVAQGKPIDEAIKNGIVNAGLGVYSPEATKALSTVLESPAVAKIVVNAGSSMIKTAAAGGNADQITDALTNSLVNSGTNAAFNVALKDVDPKTASLITSGVIGAATGGAEGAAKSVVNTLISQANKPDVAPTGDVKALPPDQVAALTGDQITDTPLIPLEEAPSLPDNTVTEVLTNAGLVDGSKDEDLTSPAASDQAFQDALDRSTTSDIPVENKPIEDILTDAGLVTDEEPPFTVEVTGIANPLIPLEEAPPLPDNTVTEVDLILKDLEEAPPLPDNTVTEVIAGEDNPLLPLEPAPPLPDNTVKEVIADTPGTPVTPKIPVAPKTPVTPKIPTKPVTPVTPTTPVKSTDPVEQLYQTTTQSQPTTLADIQYYLDMTGADILPPTNERNPVESLLNQYSPSMSIEELLRNLRS